MKTVKPLWVVIGLFIISAAVILIVTNISRLLLDSEKPKPKNVAVCNTIGTNHNLVINNDRFDNKVITAKKCDSLTITNKDITARLMAFGEHDDHIVYDGVNERKLLKDESFTVTLNMTGSYIVHDHLNEKVEATFFVN